MNAMYINSSNEHLSVNNVSFIHQKNNIIIYRKSGVESKTRGDIVQINDADIIQISDYFGSAFRSNSKSSKNKITSLDIIDMNPNTIKLLCNSAQSIGNRVVVKFTDGRKFEISGNLISGEIEV